MRLCPCGFANLDDAARCAACGSPLAIGGGDALGVSSAAPPRPSPGHDMPGTQFRSSDQGNASARNSMLCLEEARSGAIVRIPAPGGILGRAGDFEPDLFSPRVSGVHAVIAVNDDNRWTIEHTGRNASAVERGSTWSDLRTGAPQPLFGGETLKLADMVFRVRIEPAENGPGLPSFSGTIEEVTQRGSAIATESELHPVPPVKTTAEEMAAEEDAQGRPVTSAWSVRCPVCGTEYAVEGSESRVAACTFCKDPLDARQIARVAARTVPTQ